AFEHLKRSRSAAMAGCDMESQMSGISPQQVRLGFIRKVYGIVCAQVTATSIFAGACVAGPLREPMVAFAQHRPGLLQWGTLIASLLALLLCRVGKDRYPLNLVGLGLLTSVMAVDVGVISAMVSSIGLGMLVVEAALITGLLTAGLTLRGAWSRWVHSEMSIRYLGTFIHVDEEAAPAIRGRASSVPCRRSADISQEERTCREYLKQLPERLPNWPPLNAATIMAEDDAVGVQDKEVPSEVLMTGVPGDEPDETFAASSSDHHGAGSVGHPQFCNRPCVYASKGACVNGLACAYCHLQHANDPKLNRRQRWLLRAMPEAQVLALMHAALKAKLKKSLKTGILPIQKLIDITNEFNEPVTFTREMTSLLPIFIKLPVSNMLGLSNVTRFRLDLCEELRAELARLRD
ncbi:unnamed protein product, partial [Effrenium voratum]